MKKLHFCDLNLKQTKITMMKIHKIWEIKIIKWNDSKENNK